MKFSSTAWTIIVGAIKEAKSLYIGYLIVVVIDEFITRWVSAKWEGISRGYLSIHALAYILLAIVCFSFAKLAYEQQKNIDRIEGKSPLQIFKGYLKRRMKEAVDINSFGGDGAGQSLMWRTNVIGAIGLVLGKEKVTVFEDIIHNASQIDMTPIIHPRYAKPNMPRNLMTKPFDLKDSRIHNHCHNYLLELENETRENQLLTDFVADPMLLQNYD